MATIQWRPEINLLTTPRSHSLRFVPRNTADGQYLAADIHRRHPNFSPEVVEIRLKSFRPGSKREKKSTGNEYPS